jgi:hypothetical protein
MGMERARPGRSSLSVPDGHIVFPPAISHTPVPTALETLVSIDDRYVAGRYRGC